MKKEQKKIAMLLEEKLIHSDSVDELLKVSEKFSVAITPYLLETLKSNEAIARQFLPRAEELVIDRKELTDPIGDNSFLKVKGVVHRYPDRCLLMPVTICPAYCRFCFRREKVGKKEQTLSLEELEQAYAYIAEHKEIWEVILTGGDPLFLKPKKIQAILNRLENIEHVEVLRIHTRIPVVDPARITDTMIQALKTKKALYVVLHANHPSEFTDLAKDACGRLVDAGIPLLSQTVLLKGINDDPVVMGQLMRTFVKNRIKPYYLHHADLAEGTSHFRTTIPAGQSLVKALRGQYSGLCQPTYVLDIPGGHGKVPIQESQIEKHTETLYCVQDPQGNKHNYESE